MSISSTQHLRFRLILFSPSLHNLRTTIVKRLRTPLSNVGSGLARRWRRQRLSALVESRLFGSVGKLVQSGGCANPALRLSFSVRRRSLAALAPCDAERRGGPLVAGTAS